MTQHIEFDELEVLREQVQALIQKVAGLEAERSRLHAMLSITVRKQASAACEGSETPPEGATGND